MFFVIREAGCGGHCIHDTSAWQVLHSTPWSRNEGLTLMAKQERISIQYMSALFALGHCCCP